MNTRYLYYISLSIALISLFTFTEGLQAHKPVTSKYTYYDHIQPLFRFYCGGCHVTGGIAPMSLMTYKEAYPWAESIIENLLADSMHPWHDDEGYGLFTHDQRMTPRQLDMIIDWANGGTPEGKQTPIAAPAILDTTWVLGLPDLLLPMPTPVILKADRREKTVDITLATGLDAPQWLTAIDLKPGYPGMVHHAIVYLSKNASDPVPESNTDIPADQILGTWIPGRIGTIAEEAAYPLPADARLTLRIFYRKTWRDEGVERSDRSTLGLYFVAQPLQPIRTLVLQQTQESQVRPEVIRLEQTFARDIVLKSILPGMSRTGMSVQIAVVTPTGDTMDLLRIAEYDQNWPIRYDFGEPVYVPQGSRILITGTYRSNKQEKTDSSRALHRMKVWVDYTL